jgi:hypothetical protein
MRTIMTVAVAMGTLALCSAASSITVDLEWSGSGTNVTASNSPGNEVLTLDVYATFTVPPGLTAVVVSIRWDSDALSLVSCEPANQTSPQYVAGGRFEPIMGSTYPCIAASPGLQPAVGQQAVGPPWTNDPYLPGPGKLEIASLQFHVTGLVPGNTIVDSFFNPLADGWADNDLVFSLNGVLGTATVHAPEPTTAILVGCGLLSLVAAGRRRG